MSKLGQTPKLCILFSDVLRNNGETVMEQLTLITDGKLPIVGGISADSWRFSEAKQFYNKIASFKYILIFTFSWGI